MLFFSTICFTFISICNGIYNGQKASLGQYKYMASLRNKNNQHIDAGILISFRFIVTTARILDYHPVKAQLGSLSLLKGIFYDIEGRYKHPGYSNVSYENNVGLLRTKRKVALTEFVQPIQMLMLPVQEDIPLTAMGWGFTEEYRSIQNDLRWAKFISMSNVECQNLVRDSNYSSFYNKKVICVHGYQDYNQAWGPYDLGGGLVLDDTLVGILFLPCMANIQCKLPLMAYRVQDFIPWIFEIMIVHEC